MEIKQVIELAAIAVMVLGTLGAVANRLYTGKGIGYRVLQWLGIVILPPTVLILALEKMLTPETLGAVVGALVGFAANEFARRKE